MTILAIVVLVAAFVIGCNLISFGLGANVDHWWQPPVAFVFLMSFPVAIIGCVVAVLWAIKQVVGVFA